MAVREDLAFSIGGALTVRRLGFGAMRLTGPGEWGPPPDRRNAARVAARAIELGVTFFDTADSYGPGSNEEFIAETLFPYPAGLVIGTKAGRTRASISEWTPLGRPEYLRQQAELSLRRLRLDRIDLFQLHRVDPLVPYDDQLGALRQLQDEGKIRYIGLSEVTVDEIKHAQAVLDVASVQNLYHLTDRRHDAVVDYCEQEDIAFIPWLPLAEGAHTRPHGALGAVAGELGATPAQVALAWLLRRSPVIIPIPGTGEVRHLEANVAAAHLELSGGQYRRLSAMAPSV
jgi:pyridoxine 4-dehydrogenase